MAEAPAMLTLYDDGAAGDGVYAGTAGPLPPGEYLVVVEAAGPGF